MSRQTRILVTGGAGYVGSHVCKALSREGFLPITCDNLFSGHRAAVNWGPLEVGDVTDKDRISEVIDKYRPQAVMHFAAHIVAGESVTSPSAYYNNNVGGTLCLLEAMRDSGVNRLVFSSTAAIYGVPQATPIPEHHPKGPINPYGASKLMIEQILEDFDAAYGFRSIALRYFNAAGADPDGDIGEGHDPETHAIPLAVETALGRRPHFEIFGTDYPTPDGTAIRDYTHVSDLAAAHVQALKRLLAGGESIALNLGTGRGHSVREVVEAVEQVSGRTLPVREGPRRPGDPPVLVADAGNARQALGWSPKFTGLVGIVESAWRWHARGTREELSPGLRAATPIMVAAASRATMPPCGPAAERAPEPAPRN